LIIGNGDSMNSIKLTKKQRDKLSKAFETLNSVRQEIQDSHKGSDINWYLEDSSNMNLMNGSSHSDDHSLKALTENVIETFTLDDAGGGGW